MKEMGQKPTHLLLLVNDGTANENAVKKLAEAQTDIFESILVRKISPPKSPAWPDAVNHVFRAIARNLISPSAWVDKSVYQGWFYFEPDVTPLFPNWADILDAQYEFQKKPFMGVKSIVNAMRGNTPITISCMNGAGCYSFDGQHYSPLMMLGDGAPWDVLGLAENQHKIAYIPDSAYSLTYGVTKCARKNSGAIAATKTVQDGTVSQCEFVLNGQILHHGCKDGSLIDLLEKKTAPAAPERLAAALKYTPKSKKRVPKSAERAKADKDAILKDYAAGMGWSSLVGKYRVNPAHLKRIIAEGACAPA
jgi:hypothetical protein